MEEEFAILSSSPEEAMRIQDYLFSIGWEWSAHGQVHYYIEKEVFFAERDKTILFSSTKYFLEHPYVLRGTLEEFIKYREGQRLKSFKTIEL